MSRHRLLYFGFFAAVLCLLAISVLSLNFKAHAAAPTVTKTVHAYIISTKTGTVFKNPTITTVLRNPFAFTNDTAVTQTIIAKGKTVATVAAHSSVSFTFPKSGRYGFTLKSNPKGTLTVIIK